MEAMPLMISDLVVNNSFLAYFEQSCIFDLDTRQEIMVRAIISGMPWVVNIVMPKYVIDQQNNKQIADHELTSD